MSDKVKLIIAIPREMHEALLKTERIISSPRSGKTLTNIIWSAVAHGTPLDEIKAEIANLDRHKEKYSCVFNRPDLIDLVVDDILRILDRIGKESETN